MLQEIEATVTYPHTPRRSQESHFLCGLIGASLAVHDFLSPMEILKLEGGDGRIYLSNTIAVPTTDEIGIVTNGRYERRNAIQTEVDLNPADDVWQGTWRLPGTGLKNSDECPVELALRAQEIDYAGEKRIVKVQTGSAYRSEWLVSRESPNAYAEDRLRQPNTGWAWSIAGVISSSSYHYMFTGTLFDPKPTTLKRPFHLLGAGRV